MRENTKTIILSKIKKQDTGWVFSSRDFCDDLSRTDIDVTLHRLEKEGKIRRIIRGLYDFPAYSNILQQYAAADIQKSAEAIARKFSWKIQPIGDTALNYLGLSNQVVSKNIYLSDGPSRKYLIDNRTLEFKHSALKDVVLKNMKSSLVVQSFKAMGENNITTEFIKNISSKFTAKEWSKIKDDSKNITGWIYKYIAQIVDNFKEKDNG